MTLGLPGDTACEDCFCDPSLGGLKFDEDGGDELPSGAGALGLLGDAACEDCFCETYSGGMLADEDCDCGGVLSVG